MRRRQCRLIEDALAERRAAAQAEPCVSGQGALHQQRAGGGVPGCVPYDEIAGADVATRSIEGCAWLNQMNRGALEREKTVSAMRDQRSNHRPGDFPLQGTP